MYQRPWWFVEAATFLSFCLLVQPLASDLRAAETVAKPATERGSAPVSGTPPSTPVQRPALASQPQTSPAALIQGATDFRSVLALTRKLSAASTSAVVNNSITITYTVSNVREEPIDGVHLSTNLAPGVTYQSATPAADRSGGSLAWSLGQLPPLGTAMVTLTVSLPNPIPTQIENGAAAFGHWLGRAFEANVAAATLRTQSVQANLLASTPDANLNDAFVGAVVSELGADPVKLFQFVRDRIGHETYRGSLRGARGTLWSRAGNSLDKANLLVALLRCAGIPARYARGSLNDTLARQLVLSMFPPRLQLGGYVPQGTALSDPGNDPSLLAEAREHFWVQYDTGSGFVDADPAFQAAQPGQTFTSSNGTFDQTPDNLRHKVTVRMNAEHYNAGLFGLGAGLAATKVLEQTFSSAELAGKPLTTGQMVSSNQAGFLVAAQTHTYSPYLEMGPGEPVIRGTDFQEVVTNFPIGSKPLTALFLEFDVTDPVGNVRTYDRAVFDRVGFAARSGAAGASVSLPAGTAPALSALDRMTISVESSWFDTRQALALRARDNRVRAESERLRQLVAPNPSTAPEALRHQTAVNSIERSASLTQLMAALFSETSSELTQQFAAATVTRGYYSSPRIVLMSSRLVNSSAQGSTARFELDLRKNDMRGIAYPGQAAQAAREFQFGRGVLDSKVEEGVAGLLSPPTGGSLATYRGAPAVFEAARAQKIEIFVIRAANVGVLNSLSHSADTKARIADAVSRGRAVAVPKTPVNIGGQNATAWYEFDPVTGETVDTSEDGGHQGTIEYSAVLKSLFLFTLFEAGIALGAFTAKALNPSNKNTILAGAGLLMALVALVFVIVLYFQIGSLNAPSVQNAVALGGSFVGLGASVVVTAMASTDPPIPAILLNPAPPVTFKKPNAASTLVTRSATRAAGSTQGTITTDSLRLAGSINAGWSSTATTVMEFTSITAASATVRNSQNQVIGSGAIALSNPAPLAAEISGANTFAIQGTGSLAFYTPSSSSHHVAGMWSSYGATVTGTPAVLVRGAALLLNGVSLPNDTYTVSATSISVAGSGATASPNFAGAAQATLANGTVQFGPGSGSLVSGSALNPTQGGSLTGFSGTVNATPAGTALSVALNGGSAQAVTLTANPASASATQNTPVLIAAALDTSLAGEYRLTAEAPQGWNVTMTGAGQVRATPPSGAQSGSFPIYLTAVSTADGDIAAQAQATVTLSGTQPGVELTVTPDALFTVPIGSAELQSAYRAEIRNLGPAADTFQLSFPTPPPGFELLNPGTQYTIPPGGRALAGIYLRPTGNLPAPNTVVPFSVRAASTTSAAISQTVNLTFTVPSVQALGLTLNPEVLTGQPGATLPVTLNVSSVGNVPVAADLAALVGAGLSLNGLTSPVNLNPGQSSIQNLSVAIAANTPVGDNAGIGVIASYGPANARQTRSAVAAVSVTTAAAQSAIQGALAAQTLGRTDISQTLSNLSSAMNGLASNPGSATHRAAVLAYVDNLIQTMNAPYLASFVTQLQTARAAIVSSNAGNQDAALNQLDTILKSLNGVLSSSAAYDFDFYLLPNTALATPGSPTTFNMFLRNRGTAQNSYTLALGPLPNGVTGGLSQTAITLAPGATNPSGSPNITITPSAGTAFEFSVTASVNGVAGSARTIKGYLGARAEFLNVASVTATPAFTNAGGIVGVVARIANSVNQARNVNVALAIKQGSAVVRNGPTRTVTLSVQSLLTTVDFGAIGTTGLANGSYGLEVTVTDAGSGQQIPGGKGAGTLLIGQPVTSSLSVAPTNTGPGASRVTSTLTTNFTSPQSGGTFTLLGSANTDGGAESLALKGNIVYACGVKSVGVVDVSNPAAPQTLLSTGQAQIGSGVFHPRCRLFNNGARLAVSTLLGASGGATVFHVFNTSNSTAPAVLTSPLNSPAVYTTAFEFTGNVAIGSSHYLSYFLNSGSIFAQSGAITTNDFTAGGLTQPGEGLSTSQMGQFEPASDPIGGGPKFGMLVVNATTALVGGTASIGFDTNGEGRLHVADLSPGYPVGLKNVHVPGTVWVMPFQASGNVVLMPALTQGWFTPAGAPPNFAPRGNLALVTVDITDPRDPKILKVTDTGIAASNVTGAQISATRYALHIGYPGATPSAPARLLLADITDPLNPTVTQGPTTYTYSDNLGASGVLGELIFSNNILYVASPNGLLTYALGGSAAPNYTAQLIVPKGGKAAYDPASFSIAPTIISGANADTLTWINPGVEQITFASNITGAAPSDTIPIVTSGTVDFTTNLGNGSIPIGGASATVEQIISIDPASRTVAPGELAAYALTLRNPGLSAVTYALSAAGVPAAWVTLPAVPSIPAGGQTTVTLNLRSALADAAGSYGFVINAAAGGVSGSVQGTLVLQGSGSTGSQISTNALGVSTVLTPASATAGQATPVDYVLRVVNAGNTTDTYNLTAALPAGVTGTFAQNAVQVPPGLTNFREVRLTLIAQQGSAPGARNFTVTATSQANSSVTSQSAGTLNVVSNGVTVTLAPASISPGGTFAMTVRNTGTLNDTFDLTLAGPGALLSTLSAAAVTLAPGASQNVTISTGQAAFASQGPLAITAGARSRGNTAVTAIAQGQINVGASKAMTAAFNPSQIGLPQPGGATFLLNVSNSGTVEDEYTARIVTRTGPIQASLGNLDGTAVQTIPTFRLPGATTGLVVLDATLTAAQTGTVTVEVASKTDASIKATAVATLGIGGQLIADAGKDRNVAVGKFAALDGTGSYDPGGGKITYQWTLVSKPPASTLETSSLGAANGPRPFFRPDDDGVYVFRLVVSNGSAISQPDEVRITAFDANVPPNADAGLPRNVRRATPATLDGSRSFDLDRGPNPLTYRWSIARKPAASSLAVDAIQNRTSANASFIPDAAGEYELALDVSDGPSTGTDRVIVTAVDTGNITPNARSGADRRVAADTEVRLDGSESNDPDNGPQTMTFRWLIASGALANTDIRNAAASSAQLTPKTAGHHVVRLEVNDGAATAGDNVLVTAMIACDASADGIVNAADFDLMSALIGQPAFNGDPLDRNNDGRITEDDVKLCAEPPAPPQGQTPTPVLPRLSVNPKFIEFTAQRGQPPPAPQSVLVDGDSVNFTPVVLFGSWAQPSQGRATPPSTVTVSVNHTGLAAGIYDTEIAFRSTQPVVAESLRVRLNVIDAPRFELVPNEMTFRQRTGEPVPAPQRLFIYSSGRSVKFTLASSANWLVVDRANGETPAIHNVSVDPRGLAPGTHRASITVSSTDSVAGPATLPVVFEIAQPAPVFSLSNVVNAASLLGGPIAPGENLLITGTNFAPPGTSLQAPTGAPRLPSRLGETQVLFSGVPGVLSWLKDDSVSVFVPYSLAARTSVDIQIVRAGIASQEIRVPLDIAAPGLFTFDGSGRGLANAFHADGSRNSATNGALPGSALSVYITGDGSTVPEGRDGETVTDIVPRPSLPISATIGGLAAEVIYAGSGRGLLWNITQVNLTVPAGLPAGQHELVIRAGPGRTQAGVFVIVRR